MDETTSSRITSMDNSATGREVLYNVPNEYGLTLGTYMYLLDLSFIMIGCSDHGGDVFQLQVP